MNGGTNGECYNVSYLVISAVALATLAAAQQVRLCADIGGQLMVIDRFFGKLLPQGLHVGTRHLLQPQSLALDSFSTA